MRAAFASHSEAGKWRLTGVSAPALRGFGHLKEGKIG